MKKQLQSQKQTQPPEEPTTIKPELPVRTFRLTVNVYRTGKIMFQGNEDSLNDFLRDFPSINGRVNEMRNLIAALSGLHIRRPPR